MNLSRSDSGGTSIDQSRKGRTRNSPASDPLNPLKGRSARVLAMGAPGKWWAGVRDSSTRQFASMQPRGKHGADPTGELLRSPSPAAALAGDRRPALGNRLPDLADRLEQSGRQPGRLRDVAADRDLRD